MNILLNIKHNCLISLFFILLFSNNISSQNLSTDLNNLDDQELYSYWQQAQAQGYTLEQVKTIALAKGVSPDKIAELESKLAGVSEPSQDLGKAQIDDTLDIVNDSIEGFTGDELKEEIDDPLFGYDFFNNTNITFTPNINLATPANYELGPGDEIVINIWGAAETTYNRAIDREGAIRLTGVGPIYVSGLSIREATKKIKGTLSKIYSGINANENSPYKVFVGVSLVNVRTVQVNIIGEVKVPGTYSLSALSTVLNALYASGGPTRQGTFREVKLIRNGAEVASFDIYKYLIKGSQDGNKTLQDQDVIIVSPYISSVAVAGAVKRPGVYEIKPDENLSDLITYMGGFMSNAYKDRLILERIEGDRRIVKEILTENSITALLKDGDKIEVKSIIDKFENRISIEGAVYREGSYELTDGLTLKGLIEKAAGLKELAFTNRGLLLSTEDGVNKNARPFSVSAVMNGDENIELKPDDVVRIYSKYSLTEEQFLTINGAVNNPNVFPYIENMTVEDLILMGGGLRDGANANVIDVYRKISDDQYQTLTENFRVSSDGKLSLDSGESFVLQPNDKVSVRFLMGNSAQVNVSIEGEVNYPGNYSMEKKEERISDLVEKSGGISPYAFVEGASLIRINPYYKEANQTIIVNQLTNSLEKTTDGIDLHNRKSFRVGIDLQKILDSKESKHNLVLLDGDILDIPSVMETVKVDGEILLPSMVRFDNSETLKDYVNKAGGFSENAKKGKVYVVFSNGDIAVTKKFLFFRSYPKLKPGAIILVPSKPESKNRLSTQEIIGITTGITTLALLINTIAN